MTRTRRVAGLSLRPTTYRTTMIAWCSALTLCLILVSPPHRSNPITAANAASSSPNQTSNNQTQPSTKTSSPPAAASSSQQQSKLDSSPAKSLQSTKGEQQQQQPTDISSMYVQIPIAEPADTGVPDGVQQTLTSPADSSDSSAPGSSAASGSSDSSKWTGPWPKKFQIGYIKQSDLHQVLIESLKGDPFVSIAKGSAAKITSSTSSSTAGAPADQLKQAKTGWTSGDNQPLSQQQANANYGQQPQIPKQMVPHLMPFGKSMYHHRSPPQHQSQSHHHNQFAQMHNFRDSKMLQPPPPPINQFAAAMQASLPRHLQNSAHLIGFQQHRSNSHGSQRKFPPALMSMTNNNNNNNNYQNQQLHFAGFPFANQPIYTTDQQQPMLVVGGQSYGSMLGSVGASRPSKSSSSNYYGTSWRPVPTGSEQNQSEQNKLNSGFLGDDESDDDSFNTPSPTSGNGKDSTGSTMNRHPVLNNYFSDGKQVVSPATRVKQLGSSKTPSAAAAAVGTKSSSTAGATKSTAASTKSLSGTKNDSSELASVNRRRSQPNATSPDTSTTSTSTTTTTSTTTLSSIEVESSGGNNTTGAPITTTTTISPTTTTISSNGSDETETQDPESVVINENGSTDITDPSIEQQAGGGGNIQSTTTMASTSTAADGQSAGAADRDSSASTTQASSASTSTSTLSSSTGGGGSSSSSTESPANQQQDSNAEAEVITQGSAGVQQSAGTASLPSVTSSGDEQISTTGSPSTSTTRGGSREETTPSSSESSAVGDQRQQMDSTLTDEALLAASARNASDISKTSSRQQKISAGSSLSKATKARPSERLVQQAGGRKTAAPSTSNSKLVSPKKMVSAPRTAKQARAAPQTAQKGSSSSAVASTKSAATAAGKTSASTKSAAQKQQNAKSSSSKKSSIKTTRMAGEKSQRLQQTGGQLVSMTAAQAQSTAQTLASLLLSRCMSSANCAHLLDVCSTKQAAIPLDESGLIEPAGNRSPSSGNSSSSSSTQPLAAAWSMPVGLMSANLNTLTQALQADKVLRTFPQWRETIESIVDQETQSGYTLILPSNDAIDRLPIATIDQWLSQPELMSQLIDNHIIDSSESIQLNGPSSSSSSSSTSKQPATRMIRSKGLQVNQHRDRMVTINGKRLVYANQAAPSGGRIHVIDGVLDWPLSAGGSGSQTSAALLSGSTGTTASSGRETKQLLDIMDTLKQCDKFDGFVTLAEGTGLTQILKQDGPMTVFVPSNEALRKIPDEELEVIKNNSTALKEFLMYHVVNGSYFSQDLRDGQQLASILDMKPIQVGVRVDGCSRRLVEANTSPMRRPDIVAKNGVIHILDWYLTVRDNDWCDSLTRPGSSSTGSGSQQQTTGAEANRSNLPSSSERLQQLGSEAEVSYATRVSMIPANHKP